MDISERLAVSSVTFRDLPLNDALARLRETGVRQFDLTGIRHYCDHFDPLLVDVGEEECARIRDLVAEHGLRAISLTTYPANPLAKDLNGDDWVEGIDAYVRLGLYLNTEYLIFPPGSPAPPAERWRGTAEHALPWQREAVRRAVNARMHPVIALQSDSLLRTSQQGIDFLKILQAPAGLAVDPAHLAAMDEDPAEAIRRMGSAVGYVVLRDTDESNYNLPPGDGCLDYPAILAALDEVGYANPLVLAIDNIDISVDERMRYLVRGIEYLRRVTRRKAA